MSGRERMGKTLVLISRIFLVLGGIFLVVAGLYASSFTPSPDHIRRIGRRDWLSWGYNLLLDLGRLCQQDTTGKWLVVLSVSLLLLGVILLLLGSCIQRYHK